MRTLKNLGEAVIAGLALICAAGVLAFFVAAIVYAARATGDTLYYLFTGLQTVAGLSDIHVAVYFAFILFWVGFFAYLLTKFKLGKW